MTGSLSQKNGKYYVVVRIPDVTGALKQKWIGTGISSAGNNKRLANQRKREILAELEREKSTFESNIPFIEWFSQWMEQKKNEVRLSTYEGYQYYANKHIIPYFAKLQLSLGKVTGQHIQSYYNEKRKLGLSGNTIKKHSVLLRGAFDAAIKSSLIDYSPVDRAKLPRIEKHVGNAYTVEQANQLLKVANDEPLMPAIVLGVFYGLRRSEVLGLRWRDIDFEACTIRIRNTVVRMKTTIESEQTKSRASNRTLFIIPETRDYLIGLKQEQDDLRKLLGDSYLNDDRVCVWPDGRAFSPAYISQSFSRILESNNLPHIRFHELRHTAGSLLLGSGLSVKQIQEYLGHDEIRTTLDIYGHLSIEGKQEASKVMGGLLKLN